MPSKKSTTIVLDESLQKTKDELAAVYGLKNLVSAGILLFSRLSTVKQVEAIKDVYGFILKEKKQKPPKNPLATPKGDMV